MHEYDYQRTKMSKNQIKVRKIALSDIDGVIEVELNRYKVLYDEFPEKKDGLKEMFQTRFKIAGDWSWVAIQNEKVLGFLSAQPTDKEPEDFVSWEVSTDNGTLTNTFKADCKNVYVVNLDVLREGTKSGAQFMLMSVLGAKAIKTNKNKLFFESRMPGFREWVFTEQNTSQPEWDSLSIEKQLELANAYKNSTIIKNDKKVRADRLLRFYEREGFALSDVVPNAFQDGESLNFGVVCQTKNPLPKIIRFWPFTDVVSIIVKTLGKNPDILAKFVR